MIDKPNSIDAKTTVGVLSTVRLNTINGLPDGKEAKIFEEQFSMAKEYGISMFLFFGDGVNWLNRTIYGYTFIPATRNRGHWIRKNFPFPDVVYNRIRSRIIEKQSAIIQLLKKFDQDTHIKLFNTRFLDKWEVYEALAKDPFT